MKGSNYLRRAKRRHTSPANNEAMNYADDDKVIGKETLASIFEVTVTKVDCWIRDGMPVEQRAEQYHEWIFNISAIKQWRTNQHH